jgi:hypothetical protein
LTFPKECHPLFFGNCKLSSVEESKQQTEKNSDRNNFSFKLPITPSSEIDEIIIVEEESMTPPLNPSSGIYSVEVFNVTNSYPNFNIPINTLSNDDVIVYADDIPSCSFIQKKVGIPFFFCYLLFIYFFL